MTNRDLSNKTVFTESYKKCEAIYGRVPSDLDIDRAYVRYMKKIGENLRKPEPVYEDLTGSVFYI